MAIPEQKTFLHIREGNILGIREISSEQYPDFNQVLEESEVIIHGLSAPKRSSKFFEDAIEKICALLEKSEYVFVEYLKEVDENGMNICRVYYKNNGKFYNVADFVKRSMKEARKQAKEANDLSDVPF